MNPERIVNILLEGEMSPEEFMSELPKHVLNKFDFGKNVGHGTPVYFLGPHGQGFIGWIQNMSPTGNMWYAYRLDDGLQLNNAEYHKTPEEAAEDLLQAKRNSQRWNESQDDPNEFMSDMPEDFWATFHIIKSGDDSVYADDPYRYSGYIVYMNKPGVKNQHGGQIRDFLGIIVPAEGKWYVAQVASPHLTQPGHGTYKREPVLNGVLGVGFPDQQEAAKALLRDYLTEK